MTGGEDGKKPVRRASTSNASIDYILEPRDAFRTSVSDTMNGKSQLCNQSIPARTWRKGWGRHEKPRLSHPYSKQAGFTSTREPLNTCKRQGMPSENSDADLFVRKTRDSLAKTLDLTGDHPPNHANIKPAAVNNTVSQVWMLASLTWKEEELLWITYSLFVKQLILLQSSPDSERLRILAYVSCLIEKHRLFL